MLNKIESFVSKYKFDITQQKIINLLNYNRKQSFSILKIANLIQNTSSNITSSVIIQNLLNNPLRRCDSQ